MSIFRDFKIKMKGQLEPIPEHVRYVNDNRSKLSIKDPVEPIEGPNPVKTIRDHMGNITKMEYQAHPRGKISAHVVGVGDSAGENSNHG